MPKPSKVVSHKTPQRKVKASSPPKNWWLSACVLGCIAFALYSNTLQHGYTLDDYSVIKENTVVRQGWSALSTIFTTSYRFGYMNLEDGLYRPLSLAMFAIEWELAPDTPAVNHWVNVLLYAITCPLLFWVLHRLLPRYSMAVPFIAALLFTVHPLHTEVVANIKSRDEILSLLFMLLSLAVLLRDTAISWWHSVLSGGLFFVALLSKESGVTMLAGFPLMLWAFKNKNIKEIATAMVPHLVVTVVFLFIRYRVLGGKLSDTTVTPLDNFLLQSNDPIVQFATAVKVLGLYLKLFFIPHPLLYDYSLNKIPLANLGDTGFLFSFALHAGALVVGLYQLRSKNVFAVFILLYLVSISLFSNIFIKIGVGMAERLMYFPSVFFLSFFTLLLMKLLKEDPQLAKNEIFLPHRIPSAHRISFVVAVVISLVFSVKTIARNPDWETSYTLFLADIPFLQESTRAHYYLGNELIKTVAPNEKNPARQKELFQQGINELLMALKIYPGYSEALSQLAVGYYKTGDYENAVKYSEMALKYNPNDIITINNLGSALFQVGRPEEAMKYYQKAVQMNPRYEDGWMNVGSIYGMRKEYPQAIEAFNKALQINPNNARAYYYIGITYRNMGNEDLAVQNLQRAKALDPKFE
jgi:tetratricopeptide (TPR) repeat protein